jgi:hypothetical protein
MNISSNPGIEKLKSELEGLISENNNLIPHHQNVEKKFGPIILTIISKRSIVCLDSKNIKFCIMKIS